MLKTILLVTTFAVTAQAHNLTETSIGPAKPDSMAGFYRVGEQMPLITSDKPCSLATVFSTFSTGLYGDSTTILPNLNDVVAVEIGGSATNQLLSLAGIVPLDHGTIKANISWSAGDLKLRNKKEEANKTEFVANIPAADQAKLKDNQGFWPVVTVVRNSHRDCIKTIPGVPAGLNDLPAQINCEEYTSQELLVERSDTALRLTVNESSEQRRLFGANTYQSERPMVCLLTEVRLQDVIK